MSRAGRGPEFSQFVDVLTAKVFTSGEPLEGQVKSDPSRWIEITCGMRGYFAVMLWDGMGFPEPWETSDHSFATREEAIPDAERWAAEEGVEFRRPLS